MKNSNLGSLRLGSVAGTIVVLGSLWAPAADAAPRPKPVYIPPQTLTVECGTSFAPVMAIVTGGVPSKTRYVQYTFYTMDSGNYWPNFLPGAPEAYLPAESGPGWPGPTFPYATAVGGVPVAVPTGANFVWAQAMERERAKPLAWGFATCFYRDATNIVINSGTTNIVRDAATGALTIIP
jgi:hypothetical protein